MKLLHSFVSVVVTTWKRLGHLGTEQRNPSLIYSSKRQPQRCHGYCLRFSNKTRLDSLWYNYTAEEDCAKCGFLKIWLHDDIELHFLALFTFYSSRCHSNISLASLKQISLDMESCYPILIAKRMRGVLSLNGC
jgi:hypothetical protein